MAAPAKTGIEPQVRQWIRKNKKENSRLEFKQRIDLSTAGAKAEFVRDMIALANSEGEFPRDDGYLVVGFKNGKRFDVRGEHYDGATFGQILDSYVFPPISMSYEEFSNGSRGRVGVLIAKPNPDVLYVVRRKLHDNTGKAALLPGQCWGRKADRKIELDGEAIHARYRKITERRVEDATASLKGRIAKLEQEGGPVLEVKRIRFEMEGIATSEWPELERQIYKLLPYAREFAQSVKHEVLDEVLEATGRTRQGMPVDVAQAVDSVLSEVMPVGLGGLLHPSRRKISREDQKLLERIEHATFELMWDACRYLRDLEVVHVGAKLYWALIRFAALNGLQRLEAIFLENARRCRDICNEVKRGSPFLEAQNILEEEIRDALNPPDRAKGG